MANPTTPDGVSTKSSGDGSGMDRSFAAALKAAESTPEGTDAWDHLEELADKLQRPDDVAELYRIVLERRLAKDTFTSVAERAVGYLDEWFGDTPQKITDLLTRIIEIDPAAQWAFERLTVMLTSAGHWDALLDLYDRTLARTQDHDLRRQLLNDAAQAAKDFADQADRAADYMQQLVQLEPENVQLVTSLERLLEKGGRWTDLIDLWESRLDQLPSDEAREARLRVARCWLERLNEPQKGLDVLRMLLNDHPGHAEACQLAERVLDDAQAELSTRRQALSLLRKNYLVAERPEDVIRVLVQAVEFIEPDERRPLHREAATRLAILGRDVEAIGHYRQLLLSDSTDADARKQLRQLAKRSGRQDLQAEALVAAAEAAPDEAQRVAVLVEAANLYRSALGQTDEAALLYTRVLDSPEAEPAVALDAAQHLDELLAHAGRHKERLAVLEKLATLERSRSVRRFVLGEAARLAESLGDADRALASWQPVLDSEEPDLEALAAVIALLEKNQRWPALLEVLAKRAGSGVMPLQRRADLVRIAEIREREQGDTAEAIDAWLGIRREFGDDAETMDTLDRLMSGADRHRELAEILSEASKSEHARASSLMARLGDIHRLELSQPLDAARAYARALSIAPEDATARLGLAALLDDPDAGRTAVQALASAFEEVDDFQGALTLLEARLAVVDGRTPRARLLREAASTYLDRAQDPDRALTCLCRALVLEPDNLATEALVMKLATETGAWQRAADAFREAAAEVGDALSRGAQLRKAEAAIHETWLDAPDAALAAYRAASEAQAADPETFESIARCAARAQQWDVASEATVRAIGLRDRILKPVIVSLESAAREPEQARALASALAAALAARPIRAELALAIEMTIALWFRDRCMDSDAAEHAALRAVEHGPGKLEALELVASLQRRHPGPPLITTLIRLNRVQDQSLDALSEAARLATDSHHDVDKTLSILEQLYRKASGMWLRNEAASGERSAPEVAEWALDRLIAKHIDAGDADRAVHALLDGTRLPLDSAKLVELRRHAAEMLAGRGERGRAIDVYRAVLDERPKDVEALARVAELCEQESRVSEALALRLRELGLIEDVERRLQLRLDHSRLTGALEAQGGRVASLRANLEDAPGHPASIEELSAVLDERGRHGELADILAVQADQLAALGQTERAAELWARVATLAESPIGDATRAIEAHSRVVSLASSNESLDALARLHLDKQEPAEAARWLERRLGTTAPADRVAVLLRLAHARIRAEQQQAATEALSTAFEEAPRNAEVRKLLLNLHRANKDWEALARVLTKAALAVADERTVVSYAREAAQLYHRLDRAEESVPALRRAVEIAGDDRELSGLLAESLLAAGETGEATSLLEALVKDFGRRRSPERAQAHLMLARAHRAKGDLAEALEELETAAAMDASNAIILMTLADLAREAGQLESAERAYRTLLVTVRRDSNPEGLPIGPSEVLLELSRIAEARGDANKSAELVVSVLESLMQNDYEAPRIQKRLVAREDWMLLERVLKARLGYVKAPHRRAEILVALGDVLEEHLGQSAEAFRCRLEAVRTDPGSPTHHQAARDHAARLERLDDYVSVVETLLSDERADNNAHVRCELLLRLGEVLEKERHKLDRAGELYAQAEATGVRKVDVWRAQARVAGARGDADEHMRLLSQLASLGEDQAETRADALYRMAEVQLASDETLAEGLASLQKALEDSFRAERAALVLERASEQQPEHVGVLDLYEHVARRSGDDRTLAHYLKRRALHPQATPEQAREAVDKATELGEHAVAEELMLRATEIGRSGNRSDDLARVDWALLELAERRMNAGDLAGAVKWLSDASEVGDLDAVLVRSQRVADLAAQPDGDLTLAAKLYERLLERAPSERRAWGPLCDMYARLGDVERLERMVDETLDGLQDLRDRNALRVALARALLTTKARADDAVAVLKEVLVEDPQMGEAQSLLIEHLERTGQTDELLGLLRRQLAAAEQREDVPSIKMAAMALAARIEVSDREEALEVLRGALRAAPDDLELLTSLLERLSDQDDPRERADLNEALVRVEPADMAGGRALALADLYESLGDDDSVLRALKLGAQRAPDNEPIRQRLQDRYRGLGDYRGLAETLVGAAHSTADASARVALLREASSVYRDSLGDATTAAQLLGQALELDPHDASLSVELARSQGAAGDHLAAIATISAPLTSIEDPARRLDLLMARAELFSAAGRGGDAVEDLQAAFDLDSDFVAPLLESALNQCIDDAAAAHNADAERMYTLRCIDVILVQGKRDRASQLLATWTDRAPDDVEALRRLRDIDTADRRWEAVAATCRRLVALEHGTAQVDAALALSHAYHELGDPDGAREGLEVAREAQPQSVQIRAELRKIYEHLGDMTQLAGLLVDDAQATDDVDDRVAMLLRAGQIYVELGDAAQAVPLLRGAHELVPGDPTATTFLADAYLLAGWFDDATALLDSVLAASRGRRTPEMAMFFHRKAQIAAATGNHTDRLELLQEAHLCNKKNGAVAAELANAAEELGDWDLAAKTLRTITLLDSDCPISRGQAFLRQGRIAVRQGDEKSAKMWARRAKREEPDSPDIDNFLIELGERPSKGR